MYVQTHCVTTFNKKKVGILCNIVFYIDVGIVKHKLPRRLVQWTQPLEPADGAMQFCSSSYDLWRVQRLCSRCAALQLHADSRTVITAQLHSS